MYQTMRLFSSTNNICDTKTGHKGIERGESKSADSLQAQGLSMRE